MVKNGDQILYKKKFKSRSVYQVGPYYHKQLPRTRAVVIDSKGSGADKRNTTIP